MSDDDSDDVEGFVTRLQDEIEEECRADPVMFEKMLFFVFTPSLAGVGLMFICLMLLATVGDTAMCT